MNGKRRGANSQKRNTQYAVELNIDELVLHGFPAADHHRIAAAVEAELARLFAEQGVPPSLIESHQLAYLNAGSVTVAPGSTPEATGGQVARTLFGGLAE